MTWGNIQHICISLSIYIYAHIYIYIYQYKYEYIYIYIVDLFVFIRVCIYNCTPYYTSAVNGHVETMYYLGCTSKNTIARGKYQPQVSLMFWNNWFWEPSSIAFLANGEFSGELPTQSCFSRGPLLVSIQSSHGTFAYRFVFEKPGNLQHEFLSHSAPMDPRIGIPDHGGFQSTEARIDQTPLLALPRHRNFGRPILITAAIRHFGTGCPHSERSTFPHGVSQIFHLSPRKKIMP